MLSVKQGGFKNHFWVFGMTRPGIEPWSPEQLANILTIISMKNTFFKFIGLIWSYFIAYQSLWVI